MQLNVCACLASRLSVILWNLSQCCGRSPHCQGVGGQHCCLALWMLGVVDVCTPGVYLYDDMLQRSLARLADSVQSACTRIT